MSVLDLDIGNKAQIIKIAGDMELKKRFYSFGITQGAYLKVENITAGKNTFKINIDDTLIALRKEEAQNIYIKKIED
jgi:Fe2+ transport system protein FeoA